MLRSQAVYASVLFLGLGLASASAQQDNGHEGPAPVNSTQSLSAGARDDLDAPPDPALEGRQDAEDGATSSGHSGGAYGGVVPGAPNKVRKPAPAVKGPPTITWPGFQMRPDGSSRVFIESTKAIEPKVLPAGSGKFELQLPGARVADKTNRLPLDTRFFNTPVTKVSVTAARSGAVVVLELRAPITPHVSSDQGPSGYYFTYIELPKGEYLKTADGSDNKPTLQAPKPTSKVIGASASSLNGSARAQSASAHSEASVSAGVKLGR